MLSVIIVNNIEVTYRRYVLNGSLRIGQLFGIGVYIHYSWLLVFLLFSFTLSEAYLPTVVPELTRTEYWTLGSSVTILLFASILVHELAHSLTAMSHNIPIRRITLFIFGGVAQLEKEPELPSHELKITIAGPLASYVLALIFFVFTYLPLGTALSEAFRFLALINFIVATINLVPAFPLDGGRVLRALLWHFTNNLLRATKIAVTIGSFFAFIAMGAGLLMVFYQNFIVGLWYIFLGWMLYMASQSSYNQLTLRQALSGVKISDIMSTKLVTVNPESNLNELVNLFFHYRYSAFPVTDSLSSIKGLVTLHQVKEIPKNKWETTYIEEIMTPYEKCYKITPEQEAVEVMMKMAKDNTGRALVVQDERVIGILSKTDIMRLIDMQLILGIDEKK